MYIFRHIDMYIISPDGLVPSKPLAGNIEFRDVTFSYPSREGLSVLSDFNLQIDQGRVLAVVGASGSGKSTIGSLILRYYDADRGDILLDGEPIQDLSPQWIRQNIGVVSQVRTNIGVVSQVRSNIGVVSRVRTNIGVVSQVRSNIGVVYLRSESISGSYLRTNIGVVSRVRTNI